MTGGWGHLGLWAAAEVAARGRGPARRPAAGRARRGFSSRDAVLIALVTVLVGGGGRRWLQARRARRAVELLDRAAVTPEEVLASADHGRAALFELFRLLGTATKPDVRDAAGRALARLWKRDELIAEEEKAVVTRGFVATWRARRRYPRGLRGPIPVTATFGVPFLGDDDLGVTPAHLEWSHRVAGAERASLEQASPWRPGVGSVVFDLDPGDFRGNGPHRLVLEAKARPVGLTETWEAALPHIPFTFEFDPILAVDALLGQADEARAAAMARSVRLEPAAGSGEGDSTFLPIDESFALRDPPSLAVTTPLPCDLAHAVAVEFEGGPGRFPAGTLVVSGQGASRDEPAAERRFPIGPIVAPAMHILEHAGEARMRAVLTPDPDLGWADPDVRSVWPAEVVTGWLDVRVIRR